jgi:hypothetical protein
VRFRKQELDASNVMCVIGMDFFRPALPSSLYPQYSEQLSASHFTSAAVLHVHICLAPVRAKSHICLHSVLA